MSHNLDQTSWLEACVWPDQPDRFARLRACLEIARKHPPPLVANGDAVNDVVECSRSDVASTGSSGGDEQLGSAAICTERTAARLRERARPVRRRRTICRGSSSRRPAQTPGLPIPQRARTITQRRCRSFVGEMGHARSQRLANCHPHGYWMHWNAPRLNQPIRQRRGQSAALVMPIRGLTSGATGGGTVVGNVGRGDHCAMSMPRYRHSFAGSVGEPWIDAVDDHRANQHRLPIVLRGRSRR